jgi:hypothetical protein
MLLVVQFAILSGLSAFKYVVYFVSNEVLHQELKKFWELKNVSLKKPLNIEEREVEKHFESTHYRYEEGRCCVFLPFQTDIEKEQALKR